MELKTERFPILGGKAFIKQNKFCVWQFRMWRSSEKKYVEKSLRTKKKTDTVDLAEELYIRLRNELAKGKTLFAPTYAKVMEQYIAYKQRAVDVNVVVYFVVFFHCVCVPIVCRFSVVDYLYVFCFIYFFVPNVFHYACYFFCLFKCVCFVKKVSM